jgi:hypothetical protein
MLHAICTLGIAALLIAARRAASYCHLPIACQRFIQSALLPLTEQGY